MAWLHTWSGLLVGWVLLFVFITGTLGYFRAAIDDWMRPEQAQPLATELVSIEQTRHALQLTQQWLEANALPAHYWYIEPPAHVGQPVDVEWQDSQGQYHGRQLDAVTGQVLEPAAVERVRETGGGTWLYRLHYQLHYLPEKLGNWIVGICSMFMLVALISGIITHKKFFKDFFTFRPGKGQRSWLDAHNLAGVLALPFLLMITYSGLVFFMYIYVPVGMQVAYGWDEPKGYVNVLNPRANNLLINPQPETAGLPAPLAPLAEMLVPGALHGIDVHAPATGKARVVFYLESERILRGYSSAVFSGPTGQPLAMPPEAGIWQFQNTLTNLHEGNYASLPLRWLYFFSGLMGCALIATGLVLWTVKRKSRQHTTPAAQYAFRLVESLNIASIAGLPAAIAVYFWANRLLPLDLPNRAAWEAHCLFMLWGLSLLHACCRPARRAWLEQFGLAALLTGLLPLLNALTTDRHLGVSLAQGDWSMAGVDLTALGFSTLFLLALSKVRRRATSVSRSRATTA